MISNFPVDVDAFARGVNVSSGGELFLLLDVESLGLQVGPQLQEMSRLPVRKSKNVGE
jgi:hypothetical protein